MTANATAPKPASLDGLDLSLESMEKTHIRAVLDYFNGHRSKTAQALGIARSTLLAKLRLYGWD
jgi:two-component system NtrC family response regulator